MRSNNSNDIYRSMEKIAELTKPLLEIAKSIKSVTESFVDLFKNIILDENEKRELTSLAEKYVDHNFVIPPEDGVDDIYTFKLTKKNIRNVYDLYTSGYRFKSLYESLYYLEFVSKRYVRDAIKCFKNKQYLPCSMLLFAILDCEFLNINKDNKGNKQTINGKRAETKLDSVKNKDNIALSFFFVSNAILMLKKIFESGDNFIKEPKNINRHFIDHGVSNRKVDKYDCVMLMILCSYIDLISD